MHLIRILSCSCTHWSEYTIFWVATYNNVQFLLSTLPHISRRCCNSRQGGEENPCRTNALSAITYSKALFMGWVYPICILNLSSSCANMYGDDDGGDDDDADDGGIDNYHAGRRLSVRQSARVCVAGGVGLMGCENVVHWMTMMIMMICMLRRGFPLNAARSLLWWQIIREAGLWISFGRGRSMLSKTPRRGISCVKHDERVRRPWNAICCNIAYATLGSMLVWLRGFVLK